MKFRYLFIIVLFVLPIEAWSFSSCKVSFDKAQSKVEGTGYKFTEKTGVTAHFKDFRVKPKSESSLMELISGTHVTVELTSVDSGNPARDQNLRDSIFANLKGNSQATVYVTLVSPTTLTAKLSLNGVERPVVFKWQELEGNFIAETEIDILDYSMHPGIKLLKKMCKKLHVGKDGKSKTWSTFDLKVTSKLIRSGCS